MNITTIALILNQANDSFLMGYHQRGEGKGKLNFIGGKVADKPEFARETPEESVRREIFEESGLTAISLAHCADIFYQFPDSLQEREEVMKVYKVNAYTGTLKENPEEFLLKWVKIDCLPLDEMWESDRRWLPLLLKEDYNFQKIYFRHDSKGALID